MGTFPGKSRGNHMIIFYQFQVTLEDGRCKVCCVSHIFSHLLRTLLRQTINPRVRATGKEP